MKVTKTIIYNVADANYFHSKQYWTKVVNTINYITCFDSIRRHNFIYIDLINNKKIHIIQLDNKRTYVVSHVILLFNVPIDKKNIKELKKICLKYTNMIEGAERI